MKEMNKLYKKHELWFVIGLILIYVISNSLCIQYFGNYSYKTAIVNLILVSILTAFICKNKYLKYFGLVKPKNTRKCLYFIPLVIVACVNLYNGININNSGIEILFYVISMICVGFIEEVIFRGFLFKMIEKTDIERAIIVTSVTFGAGHIVNLLNGAPMISTLFQIFYAFILGYLFVMIFIKSGSIIPTIIAHSFINATAIFNINNTFSFYIVPAIIIIIAMIYSEYLRRKC